MDSQVESALIIATGTFLGALASGLLGVRGYRIERQRRRDDEAEYLTGIEGLRSEVRDLADSIRPPSPPRAVDEDG